MSNDWNEVQIEMNEVFKFSKDNDKLEGLLVEKQDGVGPNESWMYTIEQHDGKRYGLWGNTVLDSRFKNIEVNTEVRIEYKGTSQSEAGRTYKNFVIFTRKPKFEEEKGE